MNRIVLLTLISLTISACGSKIVIQSEPSQAEVYATIEGKADKIKLGETPLELTETNIAEALKITPETSQWLEFTFEKKEYQKRTVMVPSNRWGESVKIIKINLPQSTEQTTLAKKVVNHFFNAKKFAESKQFDQAHAEIDKILEIDSKLAQAVTMKASIYFLQNKTEDAKRLYREALTIDPGSSDAIQMLEKIQNKSGGQ